MEILTERNKNLDVFLDVVVNDLRDDVARQPFQQIHLQEFLVGVVEDRDDRVALTLIVLLNDKTMLIRQ